MDNYWTPIRLSGFVLALFSVWLLRATAAYADDPCSPREQLLSNPYVKTANTCIFYLTRTSNIAEQRDYAQQLINKALTDKKHGNRGRGILRYIKLAELAAVINAPGVVDDFLTFLSRPVDGEEAEDRAIAIGRLYELRTPLVLDRLALRSKKTQGEIIHQVAWGIANNHDLFINLDNYRRLAVGANWEILDEHHPHRSLSKRVESSLEIILTDQRK